ncbi:MAG: DUF1297 domain-containing protein [Candidatus Shapirobacteria bacterium]|nr:DUF1297 domain-containing protein [Candidatus Shapirobacteria bacterium]
MKKTTIAVLGSHSALDVCRGAKDEGFKTLVVAQKNREKTYSDYYRSQGEVGCVDECLVVDKFTDILGDKIQTELLARNAIFVPHRSFEVYLNFDYKAIETNFKVPLFGNKYLLKLEERGVVPNQYDLLEAAGIHYPKQFTDPTKIDRLCLVKVLEKERGFERAFFLVENFADYQTQVADKLKKGIITRELLKKAVIEEFILGVQVNFNFFYSTINRRLELLGTDTRRQTNIEGFLKIPATYQSDIQNKISLKYEEAGHIAVTVLESLLEDAFIMGENFVKATQKYFPPGIIGPFALQSIITAGPPKKDIVVVDISPRMPGSPGIFATPYSSYLFGKPISVGRRVAMEIKEAIDQKKLKTIVT